MKRWIISLAALISVWSPWGQAATTCEKNYSGRTDYINYTVPILSSGIIISAMRDLPIGGILFRQVIKDPDSTSIGFYECSNNSGGLESVARTTGFYADGALPGIVSTWSGHNVYDTGVPGIGLVLLHGGYGSAMQESSHGLRFPHFQTENLLTFGSSLMGGGNGMGVWVLEILLVKTGDIPAGTWTVPINLPPMVINAQLTGDLSPVSVKKDYGSRFTISGSVNVLAGTCQTPDVSVPMGQHEVSGSTVNTNWVDFNISLLNCPPMYGRYSKNHPEASQATNQWMASGSIEGLPDQPNTVGISLNPVNGYETLASGGQCAKLTPSTDTASGACLEIQNVTGTNVLTNSFTNTVTDSGLTLLASAASYQIPLKARYGLIAGSSTMTAGKADSAIEFTINYQ
ncbi:TPA: type 1 fimbrial protein [Klebsiella oxytoca]|jgi:type 1 fimbria pilin|uniref:fimbrial protein n=1 Tax=Klebsiella oxytoca TaxID=571 RepID=UPI0013D29403|nr:type 1 fimbrial protein [Klebsiella oxytoca]EIX9036624.1 type 1 fimbrial protein [Klebsiella oxytoca]EKY0605610.1 type 1 fimbrial protein [Klebsiella oxytoca]HEI8593619.1 type 1 fimbrial protein [Klebsiella oxytoca]HEJ0074473.1 type 1 fimbrial protein [Klebsiella oxytoca]HEJ8280167.1 type 1 fimbrial protein [Klebsiella oxytoca]